jgi:sulfate permease, SulP family
MRLSGNLSHDVPAGLLLAAIAIPEQLATAQLAGMPAETGLFAFAAGAVGFAVFGTNRFLSAGADSTIAPIFAGGIAALAATGSSEYVALASLLALMVGCILITAAVLRIGWIADLLSIPVITGLMAGIAVHIAVGQLPGFLALPDPHGSLPARIVDLIREASSINPWSAAIGVLVVVMIQAGERLAPRVPWALLALILAGCASYAFDLPARGVASLDALPPSLPHIGVPMVEARTAVSLVPLALIVALVCMMQTAAVLRAFPSQPGGPLHVARDFGGIGAGCVLSGCLGAFAVNASPPRTAVAAQAGGTSQVVSLVAVALAVGVLFGGGRALAFVPQAALAGILLAVSVRLIRTVEMMRILRCGGSEIVLVAISAALVIALPIQTGMIGAIVLSLLHSVAMVARPPSVELARAPGTTVWWPPDGERGEHVPGVLVFAPGGPLNFTSAAYVRNRLRQLLANAGTTRLLVIEAGGVTEIDYTGAIVLQEMIANLRSQGTDVSLARLSGERARQQAARSGLLAAVGPDHVFHTVEEAVRAFLARQQADP